MDEPGDSLTVRLNMHLLADAAVPQIQSAGVSTEPAGRSPDGLNYAWLMAVDLPCGDRVAAYGGHINPLAAPYFSMTKKECDVETHNRTPANIILSRLAPFCINPGELRPAIVAMKKAINSISKEAA